MRLKTAVAAFAGVSGALFGLPALYLAKRLHTSGFDPANDRHPQELGVQVTSVSETSISLRRLAKKPSPGPHEPGRFLIQGARGWGWAGPLTADNGLTFVREFRPGGGELRVGDAVRLDSFAFPGDPLIARGIEFEDVTFVSPLGEFPAWSIPGASDTWAIFTHGKGATRREALRMLPTLVNAGLPCLAITYRNDEDCPPAPDGMYSFGRDEWEELEGAAEFAFANGAKQLLLVGYSMGGATSLAFMGCSDHASRVAGLILDAPMLDLKTTLRHRSELARIPHWFLALSNRVSARRYGFSWDDFDHRKVAQELQVPVLLFHGGDDRTIAVGTSDEFARSRPDIVEYHRPAGIDHVRAWNADPEGYELVVRRFVAETIR
jgi:uncharacterized protein